MSTFLMAFILPLIVFAVFFAIYRSVHGKKSTRLKSIGLLELLIAYFCVLVPIGLLIDSNKVIAVFEEFRDLTPLSALDFVLRLILIFMSFHVGVCLWKAAKGAVKKAKIFLIALLVFNIVVVKGIYSLAIYFAFAGLDRFIPAKVDALMRDIRGSHVFAAIIVSWYIYLNRSQRVKEIYGTPLAAQTILPETQIMNGPGTPVTKKDGTNV